MKTVKNENNFVSKETFYTIKMKDYSNLVRCANRSKMILQKISKKSYKSAADVYLFVPDAGLS